MVTPRQYTGAKVLRTALEARLLARAKRQNADLQRLRRQVEYDRLLVRLFSTDAAVRGIPGRVPPVGKTGSGTRHTGHPPSVRRRARAKIPVVLV